MELKHHFDWQQEGTALKYMEATKQRAAKIAKTLVTNYNTMAKPSEMMPDANNTENDGDTTMKQGSQVFNIELKNATNISAFLNWFSVFGLFSAAF